MGFNVPTAAYAHVKTNHTLEVLQDQQFETQVMKSQAKSWLGVLDRIQSTADRTKSQQSVTGIFQCLCFTILTVLDRIQSTADKTKSKQSVTGIFQCLCFTILTAEISYIFPAGKTLFSVWIKLTVFQITSDCLDSVYDTQ